MPIDVLKDYVSVLIWQHVGAAIWIAPLACLCGEKAVVHELNKSPGGV